MRTLLLIGWIALIGMFCAAQAGETITEKRNIFNEKGNFYLDRGDYKKAIVFYNLAFQKDASDYFSVLKKAEVYTKLKWYPQAAECYRIVFESNQRADNVYRLKYALVLLANNKPEEFKHWLDSYSQIVEEEVKGENYLVSKEKRIQLYKDTFVILGSNTQNPDTIHFKIKYEGYQYRKRSFPQDNQLFLVLSNGDEYSINASVNADFNFSFQPMEDYKLVIQRENIKAEDILANKTLTPEQRVTNFLKPPPIQQDELKLQSGMKYQFSSGKYKIPPEYINTLKEIAVNYQRPASNTVDLTALVKELQLADEQIYTIRFVKTDEPDDSHKKFEISTVTLNDKTINIYGQSFIVVLPDRTGENFAVQTNLEELQKNFSSKKYAMIIDDSPVFKEEKPAPGLLSLMVNTESAEAVKPANRLSATEISIIPGTEYLLTLSKPDPNKKDERIEVIVPLTKGVKYNITSSDESNDKYKKDLAEFLMNRKDLELLNEEVIQISVLSKELEVQPGEDVSFHLLPVKQFGKQLTVPEETKSSLTLDGKVYEIGRDEKYTINIPFTYNRKVNFRTDLAYVQENFKADAYTLDLDTVSFASEITIDTTGYGKLKASGWLCMSVNTDSVEEVKKQNQLTASKVSIITGKEYILTISKVDAKTGKEDEIIVPLLRHIKYDFTSKPGSEEAYKKSMEEFLAGRKNFETVDGTVIDITLLSKELKIQEGDEVSFSLLPVRKLSKTPTPEEPAMSSLFLDNKVVEFTQIQKYSINMPLSDDREVNMQTNIDYLRENFEPTSFTLDVDTLGFFSEITVDTTGIGARGIREEPVKDPVFDLVTVYFDLNVYALSPEAKNTIQKSVVDELKADSRLYVTIKGFTDALGDPGYNFNLSKKRAESVKEFLKTNGIGESRIRTLSFGASQLIEKNIDWKTLDESELRKYRKVEIVIYLPK
jgi:outer membrane protein OmpA-like peptidoglycan-associated protein